jgi:hypothetical protein
MSGGGEECFSGACLVLKRVRQVKAVRKSLLEDGQVLFKKGKAGIGKGRASSLTGWWNRLKIRHGFTV